MDYEQIAYKKTGGCPKCGSMDIKQIEGTEINLYHPTNVSVDLECLHCSAEWEADYRLDSFTGLIPWQITKLK